MTEQQFRKAWGLDVPQYPVRVDMDVLPKMTEEEFFREIHTTGYMMGCGPIRKNGADASSVAVFKTKARANPVDEERQLVASYYCGSRLFSESEQPLEGMAQVLNLRRRFMLGEPLTDEELLTLNRY